MCNVLGCAVYNGVPVAHIVYIIYYICKMTVLFILNTAHIQHIQNRDIAHLRPAKVHEVHKLHKRLILHAQYTCIYSACDVCVCVSIDGICIYACMHLPNDVCPDVCAASSSASICLFPNGLHSVMNA